MHVDELVRRATCSAVVSATRPAKPEPFIVPTISAVEAEDCRLVMVDAPAAVGKSTFARWLVTETNAHFIDLSRLNVGSHGFVGNLAANSLQDLFARGDLTVVIDSLDEGLVRSGFANYEAFFCDVVHLMSSVSSAWEEGITRVILLGRSDSVELTGLILEQAGASFARTRLEYMAADQATDLILAYASRSNRSFQDEPTRRAIEAFFGAAARALDLDNSKLWSTPVGRGFAGYPPVLRAVADVVASNPQAALAGWEQPTKWHSAWHLLVDTASRLLRREQVVVRRLVGSTPENAYSPAHQLRLLAARLTGERLDCCDGLTFERAADEQSFREAVEAHLSDHPFLAEGASDVFGSMVAAVAIAGGVSMRGAEKKVGGYSRLPFMWRFFVEATEGSATSAIDGSSLGWILASLWTGTENPGWTTISSTPSGAAFEVAGAADRGVSGAIQGMVVLRGIARSVEIDLERDALRLGTRANGSDTAVFVMQDACSIRVAELVIDAHEILVESGSVVSIDATRCESPLQTVTRRPEADLHVSSALFRYPWSSAAEVLPTSSGMIVHDGALTEFLRVVGQALPARGRPAFLDGAGRPLGDDQNFVTWRKGYREALGALIRQLIACGMVTRFAHEAHGPVPTFSYRPEGFQWEDLGDGVPLQSPPWNAVDWSRITRFL